MKHIYIEEEDLVKFEFDHFNDEINEVLKKLIVLRTKSDLLESIFIDTDVLIPTSDILEARIYQNGKALELFEKAVDVFDTNINELRAKVTEAYKNLN